VDFTIGSAFTPEMSLLSSFQALTKSETTTYPQLFAMYLHRQLCLSLTLMQNSQLVRRSAFRRLAWGT